MKIDGGHDRVGIVIGDGGSFSSRGGTTIENARALADESCHELRSFVLNNASTCSERGSPSHVSVLNPARGDQKSTRSQVDSFGAKLRFRFWTTKADRGHGNRLVMLANAESGIEPVGLGPSDRPATAGGRFRLRASRLKNELSRVEPCRTALCERPVYVTRHSRMERRNVYERA